jgi:hypothetical protein
MDSQAHLLSGTRQQLTTWTLRTLGTAAFWPCRTAQTELGTTGRRPARSGDLRRRRRGSAGRPFRVRTSPYTARLTAVCSPSACTGNVRRPPLAFGCSTFDPAETGRSTAGRSVRDVQAHRARVAKPPRRQRVAGPAWEPRACAAGRDAPCRAVVPFSTARGLLPLLLNTARIRGPRAPTAQTRRTGSPAVPTQDL